MKCKKLTDKEFDTLVDMMVDHDMDFELIPLEEYGIKLVVLKFNDNSYFKCLLTDFSKAVNYINDPSSLDNY